MSGCCYPVTLNAHRVAVFMWFSQTQESAAGVQPAALAAVNESTSAHNNASHVPPVASGQAAGAQAATAESDSAAERSIKVQPAGVLISDPTEGQGRKRAAADLAAPQHEAAPKRQKHDQAMQDAGLTYDLNVASTATEPLLSRR